MSPLFQSKRKRLTNAAIAVVGRLLSVLPPEFDAIRKRAKLSDIFDAQVVPNPKSGTSIFLQAYIKPGVTEAQTNRKGGCFELSGITMRHKKSDSAVELVLPVWHDTVQHIFFREAGVDLLALEIDSLSISGLSSKPLEYVNEDADAVAALLKKDESLLSKLDLDAVFELETSERAYYAIIDIEDGDLVALDRSGKVYRLAHNSSEPEKLIHDDATGFLREYSGNKADLYVYFRE